MSLKPVLKCYMMSSSSSSSIIVTTNVLWRHVSHVPDVGARWRQMGRVLLGSGPESRELTLVQRSHLYAC